MNEASLVAFNLLVGGVGSFAVAALLALAGARIFRRAPGRASVWLLTLPFAKLVLDAARGVPEGSFLWLRARGVSQDLGSFRAGLGIDGPLLKIDFALGALSGGVTYSQSAADLMASGLARHVHAGAPAIVAALLAAGALVRLGLRVHGAAAARDVRLRALAQAPADVRRAGIFRVPIHVVPGLDGSPFTGGLVRPFIAFPEPLWRALSEAEREAALQHELAHVAELHVPWVFAAGIVRDLFWFVPFIGRLHARLVGACELAADAVATRRGIDPVVLASALVRARELGAAGASRGDLVLGAAREGLGRRVEQLLRGAAPAARFAWGRIVLRAAFVAWLAATIAIAVPFGNH